MIVEAAIKRGNVVITGRRHCDLIKTAVEFNGWKPPIKQKEQGFVDETHNYYTRSEAMEHARKAGQISEDFAGVFSSEDLW